MHVQQVFLSYLFAAAAAVPASPLTPRDEPQEKECQKAEWQFNEENYREAHTRSQLQTYCKGFSYIRSSRSTFANGKSHLVL